MESLFRCQKQLFLLTMLLFRITFKKFTSIDIKVNMGMSIETNKEKCAMRET